MCLFKFIISFSSSFNYQHFTDKGVLTYYVKTRFRISESGSNPASLSVDGVRLLVHVEKDLCEGSTISGKHNAMHYVARY